MTVIARAVNALSPKTGFSRLEHDEAEDLRRTALQTGVDGDDLPIKAALERKATPIEDFDAAIAAHAKARDATLVTANLSQMVRIAGLRIEDWSKEP